MSSNTWTLCLAVIFAGLLVAACDESEQGRVLRYQKGTYLGKPDSTLSAAQVDELRQRAVLQGAD